MIGDNIEVVIVDIRGEQVQLGISAPKDVPVHRREVYEAIVRENGRVVPKTPRSERMNPDNRHRHSGNAGDNENGT
jgi:carbon storage regulator